MNPEHSSEFVIPISYESTDLIETGKWGFQKPQTSFMTAPCQETCPAGNPIPQVLYLATEGRYQEALHSLLKENPFPGVCGRVCFHPCEVDCNRAQYDESVSIHAMERYVFDATARQIPDLEPLMDGGGKQIAVVGSGPAGLSCAYFLSLLGHRVTLFEAKKELGGVMRWGIPAYRLPKQVLKKEIQRVLRLGVKTKTGIRVGKDLPFEELEGYDAVFLSPGAQESALLGIEGEGLEQVLKGGDFLGRINAEGKVAPGKETIVIGGGNTAMDVARSALRLGSRVTIAYRRTRQEMPAIEDEIRDAEEEGAGFEFLVQPVKIALLRNRKVSVTFLRMKLGKRDQSNRRRAIPIEGAFFSLKADGVISAVGENVDVSWMPQHLLQKGLIDVGPFLSTSGNKIFAGGDAVDQPRTIVTAISAGKKAAISIDVQLRGLQPEEIFPKISVGNKSSVSMEGYLVGIREEKWPKPRDVVSYDKMNTLYFERRQRVQMGKLDRDVALKGFSEVNTGFSPEEAQLSASRCFSCGTCNYCYNCYFFCPEGVISLDPVQQTKTVDYEHCKGCGTCATACPRHVVEMKDVP
jgi:NADPH-dependent glutamate synthase beta subunit-like oxidoreductase